MSIGRRSFVVAAAAATAAAIDPASVLDAQSQPNQGRDPLGVGTTSLSFSTTSF